MVEFSKGTRSGSPAAGSAPRWCGALPGVATSLDRVGLRDVKHGRGPGNLAAARLRVLFRGFVALVFRRDPGCDLDPVFPAPDLTAQSAPCVIGEHVLARLDVAFGNAL